MSRLSAREAERQYNARAAIPEHAEIFARWRRRSAAARERLHCECDYYYGNGPAQTLDLFRARANKAPLLVFIHGGYWRSLDKQDFSFIAPPFVEAGISVAMLNYALAPAVPMESIVRQMLAACAWIWRNAYGFGADFKRLYVAGHSAGAHLAAMMLAADWRTYSPDLPADLLRGGLAVSGLFDLRPLARAPFLKADLQLDARRAAHLSPVSYRPARALPLVTAVGALESDEFKRQNRLIAAAWPDCVAQHLEEPGCNHLSVVERLAERRSMLFGAALRLMGSA